MALLNEKRNRIPLVAVLPVSGDDDSIRGQMRMTADGTTADAVLCLRTDSGDTKSVVTIGAGDAAVTFTSKLAGVLGNAITVAFTDNGDGGIAVASATGTAITVTGDITTTPTADANEVVAAILADADSLALVSAVAGGDGTGAIAITGATNLADGAGVIATETFNTDLVLTALETGSAGNDITLEIVSTTGAGLRVVVSGKAILVTGDAAVHDTADMVLAINASSLASKLVIASGGSAQVLATEAETPLAGGASNSIWAVM